MWSQTEGYGEVRSNVSFVSFHKKNGQTVQHSGTDQVCPHPLSPALRMAFLLLLLIGATWLLGLMAVNSNVMLFHYLFAICSCLQVVQRM